MATILVDLPPAPSSAAPEPSQMDVAPGPEMQQADAPSPPPPELPKQETVQEQIPSTPPQDKPAVAAPPEQKAEPKPEPPKPAPVKPKHVETKKPSDRPPAPRTTAAPRAERQAPAASARAGAAASAAALPAYREKLAAHLQRFKQYPPGAKASGEQGTAMLNFTVSRDGRVLASRLAGSSAPGGSPSPARSATSSWKTSVRTRRQWWRPRRLGGPSGSPVCGSRHASAPRSRSTSARADQPHPTPASARPLPPPEPHLGPAGPARPLPPPEPSSAPPAQPARISVDIRSYGGFFAPIPAENPQLERISTPVGGRPFRRRTPRVRRGPWRQSAS